jgi:hypothetical protein
MPLTASYHTFVLVAESVLVPDRHAATYMSHDVLGLGIWWITATGAVTGGRLGEARLTRRVVITNGEVTRMRTVATTAVGPVTLCDEPLSC